jgi:FlaA1/EpsC-like NDP-sugar epimerase
MNQWTNKRILITGVCGTVGSAILQNLIPMQPREIIGFDNNESALFQIKNSLKAHRNINLYLGDVRDKSQLIYRTKDIDINMHTAAFKHVSLCESSPRDAIKTNIEGTQNVVDAAFWHGVERTIFTSSDKAVNPTNVMGTSKLMGERLLTAANSLRKGDKPIFASTRFGNVLGSSGSVVPIFRQQISRGGPVTIHDPAMTRFIMSLPDAISLVLDSVNLAKGGEVFVTKMMTIRITDLANVMIQELAPQFGYKPEEIETVIIGAVPGEKMEEELLNQEEIRRTIELEKYYVVLPAFPPIYVDCDYEYSDMISNSLDIPYSSSIQTPLTENQIQSYLKKNGLL